MTSTGINFLTDLEGSTGTSSATFIDIYSGSPPAVCEDNNATSNGAIKLASIPVDVNDISYPGIGSVRYSKISGVTDATNTGTAAWARLCSNNDTSVRFQTDAGLPASGGGIILSTLDFTSTLTPFEVVELGLTIPTVNGTLEISTRTINNILSKIYKAINLTTGLSSPTVDIYTGTVPTNLSDAPTGTLLYTGTFSGTRWNSASAGSMNLFFISGLTPAANGIPSYFRMSSAVSNIQGTCGVSGSGSDLIVSSSPFNTSTVFSIDEFTISKP